MNSPRSDVPIIGQQHRVVIADTRIIAPNSVELCGNGLDCGASVAHLRVTDPLKGQQLRVPLTQEQVWHLYHECQDTLASLNSTDTEE